MNKRSRGGFGDSTREFKKPKTASPKPYQPDLFCVCDINHRKRRLIPHPIVIAKDFEREVNKS